MTLINWDQIKSEIIEMCRVVKTSQQFNIKEAEGRG